VLLLLGACSGGAPATTPPGSTSAADVASVATEIYAAWDAGQDLAASLRMVLRAYGIEAIGPGDATLLRGRITAGQPVLIEPQLAELARAYAEGSFVGLDAFITALNDKGARIETTGTPLTRAFLTELFAGIASKASVSRAETLPALVVALGQERARLTRRGSDPVWGDARLDPLQAMLMLYSFLYAGNDPIPTTSGGGQALVHADIASGVGEHVGGELEGAVEQAVEIPITRDSAARASLCVSLLLYGHKLTVRPMPATIYHRQTDGDVPFTSTITAQLTFEDDYWDNYASIDREILEAIGCRLPRRGPVSEASLGWDLGDDLVTHGSFDVMPGLTDDNGKAVASFKTVVETTPRPKRTFENQRSVSDAVIVQASGLVPDWGRLALIVTALRPTGTQGRGNLEVRYYVDPCENAAPRPGQALVVAQQPGATCRDSWSGTSTMLIQPGGHTVSAQVTWEWVGAAGGIVSYSPRGTASFRPADSRCTVSPGSVTGMEVAGELLLDTTVDPPTFSGAAFAVWTATYSCPDMDPFQAAAGGPWFHTMTGTVTDNGRVMLGQNDTVGTGGFRFARD
jgi:hypothetical protein